LIEVTYLYDSCTGEFNDSEMVSKTDILYIFVYVIGKKKNVFPLIPDSD